MNSIGDSGESVDVAETRAVTRPVDDAGSDEVLAAVESVETAAAALLERLRSAAPDTGDDRTQTALDDALDAVEDHLAVLAADQEPR